MIPTPRSACPINRSLEMLGDRWSLLILRDIAVHDRRSFRALLVRSEEHISGPVLSRRLSDLVAAGFLTKTGVARGKQGRYCLTELGLATIPLLIQLGHLGALIDPSTRDHAPDLGDDPDQLTQRLDALRHAHIDDATPATSQPVT